MPGFKIVYRNLFLKISIAILIFLSYVTTLVAAGNYTVKARENQLRQLEDEQKERIVVKLRENKNLLQAISRIVTSSKNDSLTVIFTMAKDTRHKAIILNTEGMYIKALDKIAESTDLAVMAINKVEDGIGRIEDGELQQKIENSLTKVLDRLQDNMNSLLIQNEAFQVVAEEILQERREKEFMDILAEGKKFREKAVTIMIGRGDYETFREYVRKSTDSFISAIAFNSKKEQDEGAIEADIVIQTNRSLVSAASNALTGSSSEDASDIFKNVLRFRKNALILYSQGDYKKAIEDLKKSNDFAIKVIRLSVENFQS
ncbi:MAG: hypothetical protein ACE5IH_05875 [Thermodesulfobacteriota bacterium]